MRDIQIGDKVKHKVQHIDDFVGKSFTVKSILNGFNNNTSESIAIFEEGGFSRISELEKL